MRIAIGASSAPQPAALELLKDFDVIPNPYGRKLTEDETIGHLRGAAGLLAGLEPLTERVFAACPELKAVARIGIGAENVDFGAAARHGIKVSNTPEAPTYAVAEMALAALLTAARQIPFASADVHKGVWKKRMGFSIRGSTILLIGYGRIGRMLESLLAAFNVNVEKYDPLLPDCKPLRELLPGADAVSLHASGQERVVGAEQLAQMKTGAVLINTARGGLVDEDAVYDALKSGKLGCYFADAFSSEPYAGKLTKLDNAVLTPHISTYTELCRREMETQAARNLMRDLNV
jgi:D-3-phosphoglycerate dehydrogenase